MPTTMMVLFGVKADSGGIGSVSEASALFFFSKKKSLDYRATSTLATKTHGRCIVSTKGSVGAFTLGNWIIGIARGRRKR